MSSRITGGKSKSWRMMFHRLLLACVALSHINLLFDLSTRTYDTNERYTAMSTNCHPDAKRTCSPWLIKTRTAGSRWRESKRSFAILEPRIVCHVPRSKLSSARRVNPMPRSLSAVSWQHFEAQVTWFNSYLLVLPVGQSITFSSDPFFFYIYFHPRFANRPPHGSANLKRQTWGLK